jgi:hypothetical protein
MADTTQTTRPGGLLALARLELAMRRRRRGVWLALGVAASIVVLVNSTSAYNTGPPAVRGGDDRAFAVWLVVNAVTLLPIAVAGLAAGRGGEEQRSGMQALTGTAVQRPGVVTLARYLGFAVPAAGAALALTAGMAAFAYMRVDATTALTTTLAGLAMLVPAVLLMVALGLGAGTLLPVRLAQIALAGGWLWVQLSDAQQTLPSIRNTLVDPTGSFTRQVVFRTDAFFVDQPAFWPAATWPWLLVNLAIVALLALAALTAAGWRWRPR